MYRQPSKAKRRDGWQAPDYLPTEACLGFWTMIAEQSYPQLSFPFSLLDEGKHHITIIDRSRHQHHPMLNSLITDYVLVHWAIPR